MSEVIVSRGRIAWSTWNLAKTVVDVNVNRAGLRISSDAWRDSGEALTFVGSQPMCEAITVALEGLGLRVDLVEESAVGA